MVRSRWAVATSLQALTRVFWYFYAPRQKIASGRSPTTGSSVGLEFRVLLLCRGTVMHSEGRVNERLLKASYAQKLLLSSKDYGCT